MNKTSLNLSTPSAESGGASSMPDVMRALRWRSWSAALEEACDRRVPILALAEPRWSNSAQRLAHIIGQDEHLRTSLSDRVVPVIVDPQEQPDLAASWRWAAVALTGTSGPPLLLLLTHEGLPFLSYGGMQFEGDDLMPSLAALVDATADTYAEEAESFLQEARSPSTFGFNEDAFGFGIFSAYWTELQPELDTVQGGILELPRHPHPQLLWSALTETAPTDGPGDATSWVRTTLDHMLDGGIRDQLDRGFHRCTRDERWVVPHFEKPVPLNAQLCAVFARAAHDQEDDQFGAVANDLAAFCVTALKENVDCVGSDSTYYTWTSKELLDGLEAQYVQPVSLHFGVVPSPLRQALRCAVRFENLGQYSREEPEVLQGRVERGRKQMLKLRQQRPSPELVTLPGYSWRAETLRWLFLASEWLSDFRLDVIEASLESLISTGMDQQLGYARSENERNAWLEDQAALLGAMLAASRATGHDVWTSSARELADVVVRAYRMNGGWRDRVGDTTPSRAITDDILPAPVATLTASLMELESSGDSYADIARTQATPYLSAASMIGPRSAAFWRSWAMTSQ